MACARMCFTTRMGGVSRPPWDYLNLARSTADAPESVAENRRRVLESLGFVPDSLVTLGQVHGARVARAHQSGHHPECDGVVSRAPGLALAVAGADCLPILYEAGRAVGAAHAGWRGTEAGVAEAALQAVCELAGVGPGEVRVHLGPCIRSCCYQIGPEVAARFPAETLIHRHDSVHFDLPAAARLRLIAAGLRPEAIEDTGACTACEASRYYSHRRDRGLTGRQWGVIGIDPTPLDDTLTSRTRSGAAL